MDSTSLQEFKSRFTGSVITQGDTGYEGLQNTIAATGAPAVVVQPKTTADITLAINFATQTGLVLSIRSGGHSVAGFSTNVGGMVVDLCNFNTIEFIDQAKGYIRVGAGAKWGEVAEFLRPHGLAVSSGDTRSVGVGGLTVGGGIGWMVRKLGLAIDQLIGAELLTADGQLLRLSKSENPDLFWAIRGGGGNFGVVISFDFDAHHVGKVYSGPIIFTLDDVAGILKRWRDYMLTADDGLTVIINILPEFAGNPPMFMLTCCIDDNVKTDAEKIVGELKAFGTVVSDDVTEKDYADVLEEAHPPGGMKVVVGNTMVKEFSDKVIDDIVKARAEKPDLILQIRGLGGAMARVPASDTAFAFRDAEVLLLSPTFLPPTATEGETAKALGPWLKIAKHGQGAYSGFMGTATDKDIARLYPKVTLARLRDIKKQYDPKNVFNQNYNIKP